MADLKKDFKECYFKMTSEDKKKFIEKALNALTKPSSNSYLHIQALNESLEDRLGVKFSRNFQKEILEKLGYKKDLVHTKVVYVGIIFKGLYEQERDAEAFINEFYVKNNDVL